MPDYRTNSGRDSAGRPIRTNSTVTGPQPGISRSGASRPGAARPSAARSAGARSAGTRPAGARPAPRPQGQRPAGSCPPQGRPAPRRRKSGVQPRFFVLLGAVVVLIVALILIFGGHKGDSDPQALPTAAPANGGMSNVTISSQTPDPNAPETVAPPAEDPTYDDEEEQDNAPVISASEQVQISPEQLCVNESLPSEWLNVLLLGTDERNLNEPARTDTMIIASINTSTGEVKLTSIMRDTAVQFDDLPKHNGTYRINAANYFGGPLYAVKTVNECFGMNIQYYVSVDFHGFTTIAEALGGIDVDITEAEMNEINKKQYNQARIAATMGLNEEGIENETLTTYGPNTHLNGRQTLAYARVRYVDNDFSRAERQRTVIIKLTEKLRGRSATDIFALLMSLSGNVTTNLDLDTAGQIAIMVLNSGITNIETLRIPENGTYTLDRRNDQEMFYDTDWEENAKILYNFIYE